MPWQDFHPITLFQDWLDTAKRHDAISEPTAMTVATASKDGHPSARILLLKEVNHEGFTFYTNLNSRKSGELHANPVASLCFYWMPLKRQVRVEGKITPVSDAEADAYFASRARGSQIGAWASQQSQPLANRESFEAAIKAVEQKYDGQDVPRPEHWSGWRLVPYSIEFWEEREFRLHDRGIFTRTDDGADWQFSLLYP